MALSQIQIQELNAAAIKPNKTETDLANLKYAAEAFGYVAPTAPETPESSAYNDAIANDPKIKELINAGNTLEDIIAALESGDLSSLLKSDGQPFSAEDQHAAQVAAQEDNRAYYEALQAKETADAESLLAQDQSDYQNYLINSGQSFEADKTSLDQQASDRGVLFSGSRVQKQKNLQRAYEQDQAYTRDKVSRSMNKTGKDFAYQYGNDTASGLSQYYNLGGNTFNPNVARGGVSSSGLSNAYNSGGYNYTGRRVGERSANTQQRAAGRLWNQGNKLLATGYQNQYN